MTSLRSHLRSLFFTPFVFFLFCLTASLPSVATTEDEKTQQTTLEATLVFENVWIAEAPPVSKVLAAYMVIKSTSDRAITIESVESETFSSTAFHKTIFQEGIAKMRHQSELRVEAGGKIILKRGGFHMMLFNPVKVLEQDDKVTFIINMIDDEENQITQSIIAIVKKK